MGEKTRRIKYYLLLGLLFFFGYILPARAQELTARGLSISPIKYDFSADPGQTLTEKMKIYNPTDAPLSVTMEVEDFRASGEEGRVVVGDAGNERYSLKKWVTVEPAKFELGPRQERFVTFTIRVPTDGVPGGKYGSLLAVTNPDSSADQTGALISQKIGGLVFLTVSGDVRETLKVKEIEVPDFSEYGPLNFGLRFENAGTVHVRPRGVLSIDNMFGQKAADLPWEEQNVMPGAVRRIDVNWDEKWLIGKYSARVVGDYGTTHQPLDSPVVYFWVLPWKLIAAVLAALALIIFILYRSRRRWLAAMRIIIRGEKKGEG